jgi:hypothetical protein
LRAVAVGHNRLKLLPVEGTQLNVGSLMRSSHCTCESARESPSESKCQIWSTRSTPTCPPCWPHATCRLAPFGAAPSRWDAARMPAADHRTRGPRQSVRPRGSLRLFAARSTGPRPRRLKLLQPIPPRSRETFSWPGETC